MIVVAHRINTVEILHQTPERFGVELDLRDYDGKIVVQHDPWKGGESFEDYLRHFHHRFLILNVKSEGIEERVLELVTRQGLRDFFFLDLSFPALVKLSRKGERRIAVRFSEHEPVESCFALQGRVSWVWVDCFTDYPPLGPWRDQLLQNFQLCLVAPELQGRPPLPPEKIAELRSLYQPAAVCTKYPLVWDAATS